MLKLVLISSRYSLREYGNISFDLCNSNIFVAVERLKIVWQTKGRKLEYAGFIQDLIMVRDMMRKAFV
jgi:hypothetical protein